MAMIFWSWDQADKFEDKLSTGETAQVATWVGELENDRQSRLTLHTRYLAPMGVEANTTLATLEGLNALRIDLQRVVSSGRSTETTIKTFQKDSQIITDQDRIQKYLDRKAKNRKGEVLMEIDRTVTTYEAIWSLFAVQKTGTYNQVFVLNNPSFTLTTDDWTELFQYTLDNSCSAIVTTARSKIPNGFVDSGLVERT